MEDAPKVLIGRNLKSAREAARLSQDDLARQLEISRATLSYIENGHTTIDSTTLLKASRVLGCPVTFFFERTQQEDDLYFLSRVADGVMPEREVRFKFRNFCKAYRELEDLLGVADHTLWPPEYTFPTSFHPKSIELAEEFARQVARSERQRLGIGQTEPIDDILLLLDEIGIRVFNSPVTQPGVFALSACSSAYGLCILVNTRNTIERKIFSIGHEYGHLLMHRRFYSLPEPQQSPAPDKALEKMANVFTACFLVPENGLKAVYRKIVGTASLALQDLVFLKKYFKVSAKMMLTRLLEIEAIRPAEKENLQEQLSRVQRDDTKEFAPLIDDSTNAHERDGSHDWSRMRRFEFLAKKAFLSKLISQSKVAELLGVTILEAMERINIWQEEMAIVPA
jgi:Zn-dependent peptidase ImmA (M78 family)/transcriptional regulator with XRE-family HTH domain